MALLRGMTGGLLLAALLVAGGLSSTTCSPDVPCERRIEYASR